MAKTDFLTLNSLSQAALFKVLERAHDLKKRYQAKTFSQTLAQHVLAMIFEKSSTRTRVSFEAGMTQLGGSAIFLSPTDTQLGRGEPLEDTARVLSEMVSAVMIRTDDHNKLVRFAKAASIPVINGLSDSCHPCQLLADVQTMQEIFGEIQGLQWPGLVMGTTFVIVTSKPLVYLTLLSMLLAPKDISQVLSGSKKPTDESAFLTLPKRLSVTCR